MKLFCLGAGSEPLLRGEGGGGAAPGSADAGAGERGEDVQPPHQGDQERRGLLDAGLHGRHTAHDSGKWYVKI